MGHVFSNLRPSTALFRQPIHIFCVLYECRSFTKAAALLKLSQSVVSRSIADLEASLQTQLFDHRVRPIQPTQAGQRLYELLTKEFNSLDDQLGLLKTNPELLAPLRIGFVESLARSMSWDIVSRLQRKFASITVLTGICAYLLRLLDDKALDIFLSPDPFTHRNDLDRRFLFREPSIIVLPKNSGLPEKPTWQQLQFCKLPMVQYHKANSGGNLDEKFFNQLGLHFTHRFEVDINALSLDYIAHGAGWTITRPTSLVQHPDLAELVDVRPMPEPLASRDLYVISRKGFTSAVADEITTLAVACFVEKVVPMMLRKTPWIKPYLQVRSPHSDSRINLFPDETPAQGNNVYIL